MHRSGYIDKRGSPVLIRICALVMIPNGVRTEVFTLHFTYSGPMAMLGTDRICQVCAAWIVDSIVV